MGAFETGSEFLKGILAKLPENLRNQPLEQVLAAAEAKEALTTVGDSVLARSDYSRKMDEIATKDAAIAADYEKLQSWYQEKQGLLTEYAAIKPEYDKLKAGDPVLRGAPQPLDPDKYIDRATFRQEMNKQQIDAANYLGLQNALTLKHLKDFNEVIDTRELLVDPNLGKQLSDGRTYGLLDAYQTKYGDKLAEKAKADEDLRINKLVDEKLSDERKKMQAHPFPIHRSEPSVLDLLDPAAPTKPKDFTVESAVNLYNELQQQRAS